MDERLEKVLGELNRSGFRITRIRKAMIEVFLASGKPLSAVEVMEGLEKAGVGFNKATIYRELAFLKESRVVQEVQFIHERLKRYEPVLEGHHHHLVCINCKKVEDITLEKELDEEERLIYSKKGFKVLNHSLEFLGLCTQCH